MSKTSIKRLQALSKRGRKEIPSDRFRMDRYVTKFDLKHNCGFICCLVGWLPALFPDTFRWFNEANGYVVRLVTGRTYDFKQQVQRYFGIDENIFNYMFAGRALTNQHGTELLSAVPNMRTATKDQALDRVDNVVRLIRAGIIR